MAKLERPAAELARFHEVLQRRDRGVLVAECRMGDLVENYDFAGAENADRLRGEVDEKVRGRRFAAGNREDARRNVAQQKGLAGLPRPEFEQIDVALDQGNQPRQKQKLMPSLGETNARS